jgi:hypothetical protein
MMLLLTVCFLAVPSIEVTVRPLQGEANQGTLIRLNDKEVVFETAAGQRTFPTSSLHHVKVPLSSLPNSEQTAAMALELIDDSTLPATAMTLIQGQVIAKGLDGKESKFQPRLVRWVRFHRQDESVQRQWVELVGGERTADVLVVRKSNTGTAETGSASGIVLDQLEGIVHEMNETSVAFEYDGDRINVPRAKLEGILFRTQVTDELPEAVCRVKDALGGVWIVRSLQTQDNQLRFTTVAGAEATISLERLLEVDFSAANLSFLSDLEPESVEWRPYFQSPATPASLVKWFQPKRDQGADGTTLTLAGETYEKGLALHSRSLVSYRLTKSYQRLVATVGVEERYRSAANLTLVVTGNDRTLLTRAIKGTDPPFELELDISNVRRLKILVDFGEDRSDAGDLLYLCNARLVK